MAPARQQRAAPPPLRGANASVVRAAGEQPAAAEPSRPSGDPAPRSARREAGRTDARAADGERPPVRWRAVLLDGARPVRHRGLAAVAPRREGTAATGDR